MVTIEEVKRVLHSLLSENVLLTPDGNEVGRGFRVIYHPPVAKAQADVVDNCAKQFDLKRISQAVQEIPSLFKEARTMSKSNSYGWKHVLEHATNNYISNGDFIMAMILSGFRCKFNSKVNPVFYARLIEQKEA